MIFLVDNTQILTYNELSKVSNMDIENKVEESVSHPMALLIGLILLYFSEYDFHYI